MNEPVQKFVIETLLFLAGLLVTVGLPWLVLRRLRSGKPSTTPQPILDDGAGGKVIPLLASFSGLRGLPWIGLASNNLNPRLVITPDGISYRVLGLQACRWADIAQVDVRTLGATVNIGFGFRGSPITFDANVGSIILAARTLALLPTDVVLTSRARSVLTEEL